jgi:signal peptidase
MEPSMHTGDLAVVREVDPDNLAVGDIVRFTDGDVPIIHRIIEIEETGNGRVFVTQGDNNGSPDPPILEGQILGEVVFTIPEAGWVPIHFSDLVGMVR